MRARYTRAMERLYLSCVGISGLALVVITLIIPYGVFMRYAMNSAASWPEPLAVLLMVLFSFVGGAAVYRANLHMAVVALLEAVNKKTREALLALVDLCMLATALFMLGYGVHLAIVTWHQVIAEFPGLSVGITYLPIPVGGLALVNIVASTLFGCISGSSVADTASIGSVMIPEMIKRGYPRVFATNITICGSVQAIVLPPSHNSVIYSIAAGGTISIAHLFMAGIFPGLLFGLCLVVLVLIIARKRNFPRGEPISLRDSLKIALDSIWGLVTIVIILGGILSGVFTATESAAVACIYAFLVTMFVYRDCKWSQLPHLVHRTVKTVAMVMMLIGFSVAFGYLMALMQLPAKATAFFLTLPDNKYVMLMLVNILLLALGTFMDLAPMLLICTPILLPMMIKLGVDPVHFGMIMLINLGIGLITPPVGPTLFVGCAIGKVTIEQVSKELWPFYGAMCMALLIITYVPAISLWLPSLLKL